ncbi:helix-turn-helix domain-containing protein [Propionivibrio limicola]|uniref:helix-turn-helix domain-containing protein n=1 Tax=Propionivibrio limicola TaxID=167645 RepID=UPI001290D42E|nr:helix-turn-helix transcriptional regulator [Propionivibrio limicola]
MSSIYGEEICTMGGRLRFERDRLRLSQAALAVKIDTSDRTVKKYEKDVTTPRAIELSRMREIGMDVWYILTGSRGATGVSTLGVRESWPAYTPAERLADFIATLTLSDKDATMLRDLALRLAEGNAAAS